MLFTIIPESIFHNSVLNMLLIISYIVPRGSKIIINNNNNLYSYSRYTYRITIVHNNKVKKYTINVYIMLSENHKF